MKCNHADLVQHQYSCFLVKHQSFQSHESIFCLAGLVTSVLSQTVEVSSAKTSPSSSFTRPLEHYISLVQDGQLREDPQQRAALEKLDQMQKDLRGYSNERSTLFSKVNCTKMCGLEQPKNMLQMCFNKFRLLLSLQQFFSYRKPPKGYYIYGDVGKFCGIMLWLSQICLSCYNKLLRSVINAYFLIFLILSGTGKTMVMDMFYDHVETAKKKRVHFHGFMLDVHKRKFMILSYFFQI